MTPKAVDDALVVESASDVWTGWRLGIDGGLKPLPRKGSGRSRSGTLPRGPQKKWNSQTNFERSTAVQFIKFNSRLDTYLYKYNIFCLNLYLFYSGYSGHSSGREKRYNYCQD